MSNNVTTASEMQRRIKLVEDVTFRQMVAEKMQEIGVTAQEWEANAAIYWLYMANEICAKEDGLR